MTITSGTIQATTALTPTNNVTFNSGGVVTIAGSNPITFGGALGSNTITLNGSDTITATDTGGTTITGFVTGTGASPSARRAPAPWRSPPHQQ